MCLFQSEAPSFAAGASSSAKEIEKCVNIEKGEIMYSIEEFTALSIATEQPDYEHDGDFWYVIDHLPVEHLILWGERLTKTRYLSNKSGEYWLDLIDLIRIAKDPMNKILTKKQKRYMSMLIISCWDDLEYDYVL